MGSVNLVVIVESARDLITHGGGNTNEFHVPSIVAVGAALGASLPAFDGRWKWGLLQQTLGLEADQILGTFVTFTGVKFLLFLYCYSLRTRSSQVLVLWEDHRNDLFINSFGTSSSLGPGYSEHRTHNRCGTGILMSAGGSKLRWCKCATRIHGSLALTIAL